MSIQLHLFDVSKNKETETDALGDVSPFALFKILLDEQNPFYGIKHKGGSKGCHVDVQELRASVFSIVKFALRFLLVMGVLYLSAIVFAYLEHPGLDNDVCNTVSREELEGVKIVDQVRKIAVYCTFGESLQGFTSVQER